EEEAQRLRLLTTSHLDDGEFARLLYGKIEDLIGALFKASLDRAVAAGEASRIAGEPLNLFWFAHHAVLMTALSRLPGVPCLSYGNPVDLERQDCRRRDRERPAAATVPSSIRRDERTRTG